MLNRTLYQDKYDNSKTYEVTKLNGGYYLKEMINGKQFGRGVRVTKQFLDCIGIAEMEIINK